MERFDDGHLEEVKSERFNRVFYDSTLDRFNPENPIRCEDRYGDKGWIVGIHKELKLDIHTINGWWWVVRDRDNALIGIQECNLK